MKFLIVDALGAEKGERRFTRDVIGAAPRTIAGILSKWKLYSKIMTAETVIQKPEIMREYDVLMVSGMSIDLPAVMKIVNMWKSKYKGEPAPAVVGGPIAADPYLLFRRCNCDLAVIGEGEETLEELLSLGLKDGEVPPDEELMNVRGIAWRSEEGVVLNKLRPILSKEKLNSYFPSIRHILDYPTFFAARIYVECVRGCSNFYRTRIELPDGRKCSGCGKCREGPLEERYYCPENIPPGCGYCSVPSLYGPPRSRYPEHIVREIKELVKLGARRIILGASDFLEYQREELVEGGILTDPRWPPPNYEAIEKLLSMITSLPEVQENDVYISIENAKASLFDERGASIIAKYLPGTTIHFGCETGSEKHCIDIGRPCTPREVLNAVKIAKKYGLRPYVYFIHGLPGQTMETARETVDIMRKFEREGVEKITIYRFKPLPFSAFGDFRSVPAVKDPASRLIVEEARRINKNVKKKLLGRTFRVIIAEPYKYNLSYGVGYVINEGPVILVRNAGSDVGKTMKVRITRVLSDRLVEGVPIR
ncbi:MAG: B12-binding domain-containing radical SAM protein [Candidatus Baldrarchaeia archaeon]